MSFLRKQESIPLSSLRTKGATIWGNITWNVNDLTGSGSRLMMLRYNASEYLKYLTENLIMDVENVTVSYMENVTDILELFNETLILIEEETETYEEYQDEIDEYEFFDEIR